VLLVDPDVLVAADFVVAAVPPPALESTSWRGDVDVPAREGRVYYEYSQCDCWLPRMQATTSTGAAEA